MKKEEPRVTGSISSSPMGIGKLGLGSEIRFIRKFRWTIQAFDECDKSVLPETFVKVSARPSLATESKEQISFTLFDAPKVPVVRNLHDLDEKIDYISLKLYDGCGVLMETWSLKNVELVSINFGDLDFSANQDCSIDIVITYSETEYKNHTPLSLTTSTITTTATAIPPLEPSPQFKSVIKKLDEYVVNKKEVEENPKKYGDVSGTYADTSNTFNETKQKFERVELRESNGMFEVWGAIACKLTGILHWRELTEGERKTITLDKLCLTPKTSNVEEQSSTLKPVSAKRTAPVEDECTSSQAPNVCQALPLPSLI